MTPRVTVLIAVKDGLPWIRDAVESVLAQTFSDFELLVVDDGSTDGTGDAVAAYGDARIRVLRNERNLGQVPSLNRGLAEARGEYVARLDADDRMLPARLARQVAVLDAEPGVALVGTWMDVVDEHGRLWGTVRGHVRSYVELVHAILADRYPWGHPSLMYRADVVARRLGGYDASLAPAEDKDLYRRLALARLEARCVEEPLVLYRRHEAQLSQARVEVQLRHDHAGQDALLAEIAGPGIDLACLRRLLAGDPTAWACEIGHAAAVDQLLRGAADRLDLDPREARELEHLVAADLARAACGAWRAGVLVHWRRTPAAVAFATRHGAARHLPAYAATVALAPFLRPAASGARALARSQRLDRLRNLTSRSRALRRVYARVVRS